MTKSRRFTAGNIQCAGIYALWRPSAFPELPIRCFGCLRERHLTPLLKAARLSFSIPSLVEKPSRSDTNTSWNFVVSLIR